jgi:plastocyanin
VSASRRTAQTPPATRTLLACALCAVCALGGLALVAGAASGHARGRRTAVVRSGKCSSHRRHRHRRCRRTPTSTLHGGHRRRAQRRMTSSPAGAPGSTGALGSTNAGGASGSAPSGSAGAPGVSGSATGAPTGASGGQTTGTTAVPPIEPPAEGPVRVQVIAKEYSFTLSRAEVPAGKVIVEFINDGEDSHNLHFQEPAEASEAGAFPTSSPGFHGDLTLNLHPGSYTLFCSLPGHEAKGMKATLIVR